MQRPQNEPVSKKPYISIGKVVNAHGVEGAIKVYSYAESLAVFSPGNLILMKKEALRKQDVSDIESLKKLKRIRKNDKKKKK